MTTPPPNPDLHPMEAAERQRAVFLRVVRTAFLIMIVTLTTLAFVRQVQLTVPGNERTLAWLPVGAGILFLVVGLGLDLLTPRKKIATISGVVFGVLAGLLVSAMLGFVLDVLLQSWVEDTKSLDALKPIISSLKLIMGVALCYLGVSTVLQTQDDFRLVIPYVEFAKQLRGPRALLLDSSALIDARIADVGATGLLQAPLVIPRFVVAELQLLADSSDAMKRGKGRRGLDIIARMQRTPGLDVTIDETPVPGKAVDQMLVEMARTMSALIVTTDVGLARVAQIQQVLVVNMHDLANALKPNVIAGESVIVKLLRRGEQPTQAVGYLGDGTMVVAEDGAGEIGQTVSLVVTTALQTSAGKMIFGRIHPGSEPIAAVPSAPALPAPPAAEPGAESSASGEATEEPPRDADGGRSPFPPKAPRSIRAGSPRNPRR